MTLIEQMLTRFPLVTQDDRLQALRQTAQEIALAGLDRASFFESAAFYGGTCLRILHGLPRYSEDLDFSLLKPDSGFRMESLFPAIRLEFESVGWQVELRTKSKTQLSAIESAFLKPNAHVLDILPRHTAPIRIKLEVDTDPPAGFRTEARLLLHPYSFHVRCYTLPDLFAGKMHAFLYRSWQSRVKGRDWFDFEWYVRNRHPMNLSHFVERARQSGHVGSDEGLTPERFKDRLRQRIRQVDLQAVREDVKRFVPDTRSLEVWSTPYFLELADRMTLDV